MRPKIRVTKRHISTHEIESDRLVDQASELYKGGEPMEGYYVTLEATIFDAPTAEEFIKYLQQLTGVLPSALPRSGASPTKNPSMVQAAQNTDETYMTFLALVSQEPNQEALIGKLRDRGYHFYETAHLLDLGFPLQLAKPEIHSNYQWMVRRIKEAKDPANDRLDQNLILGIKIVGKKRERVLVYYRNPNAEELYLTLLKTIPMEWPEKSGINFKKLKVTLKFPSYMNHDDRRKWRTEHHKIKRNPLIVPSKFYERYKSDIEEI